MQWNSQDQACRRKLVLPPEEENSATDSAVLINAPSPSPFDTIISFNILINTQLCYLTIRMFIGAFGLFRAIICGGIGHLMHISGGSRLHHQKAQDTNSQYRQSCQATPSERCGLREYRLHVVVNNSSFPIRDGEQRGSGLAFSRRQRGQFSREDKGESVNGCSTAIKYFTVETQGYFTLSLRP